MDYFDLKNAMNTIDDDSEQRKKPCDSKNVLSMKYDDKEQEVEHERMRETRLGEMNHELITGMIYEIL